MHYFTLQFLVILQIKIINKIFRNMLCGYRVTKPAACKHVCHRPAEHQSDQAETRTHRFKNTPCFSARDTDLRAVNI